MNIRRKPIKRGLGRRGKERLEAMRMAKQHYMAHHPWQCQYCGDHFGDFYEGTTVYSADLGIDIHHKTKRSLGGSDDFDNLVAVCRSCHVLAHSTPVLLANIRASKANINNGLLIRESL